MISISLRRPPKKTTGFGAKIWLEAGAILLGDSLSAESVFLLFSSNRN